MSNLQIDTTQNVLIAYETASVSDRILAIVIDLVLQFAFLFVASTLLGILNLDTASLFLVLVVLPYLLYPLVLEVLFNGQTIGKMIMKLKVVRLDGSQPTFANYLIRWLLSIIEIYMSFGSIGLTVLIFSSKGQRLGDILAQTAVIRVTKPMDFSDTIFSKVDDTYELVFQEVQKLSDSDIETIKEVLATIKKDKGDNVFLYAGKTKTAIENKMGITTELKSIPFLETVVKDYNAFMGKV